MTLPNDSTALDIRRLTYCYPNGRRALDEISFSLRPGEKVGLVGPSGAGKSTLLMHLNGLLPERLPHQISGEEGSVRVGGLPVCRAHLAEIRRRVGFVFQDPDDQLFCPTVREDVAFGPLNLGLPKAEVERRIGESLAAVGLQEYEERSTLQLSFGERKRVCLAGVLACQPDLLALDEPSSNLDPRARRQLIEVLKQTSGCQLIATHDLDMILELCSRVLVLDEGRLYADGPTAEVLRDSMLMEQHGLEVPLRLQWESRIPETG